MINRVILQGFVANDPSIRATENGKLAHVRIATIEHLHMSKSDTIKLHTEWHSVVLWGENAEIIDNKVRIGDSLRVEGVLRNREWIDKNGVKMRRTDIVADKVEIIDPIEGYDLPPTIKEQMETLYPQKREESKESAYEVKAPAEDPDNLPF